MNEIEAVKRISESFLKGFEDGFNTNEPKQMNEVEALELIKADCKRCCNDEYGNVNEFCKVCQNAIAIKALEKQVGNKVVVTLSEGYGEIYSCSVCNRDVSEPEKYCSMCGTKIDWSVEE